VALVTVELLSLLNRSHRRMAGPCLAGRSRSAAAVWRRCDSVDQATAVM